jgi:membrane fusion protein, multidrug efflux system
MNVDHKNLARWSKARACRSRCRHIRAKTFTGVLSLVSHNLDDKTRTIAVELDVKNADLRLGAGMYPEVQWPARRPQPSLLVPPTAILATTERTFVIRIVNGAAEWVNVARSARVGDLVEVFGQLKDGDTIVHRGSARSAKARKSR